MSDASKIDSTDSSITGFMWDWCGAGRPDPKPLRSMRLKKTIIWQLKLAETIIRTNTEIDDNTKMDKHFYKSSSFGWFLPYLILSRVSLLMVFPPSASRRSLTPWSCFWRLSRSASALALAFCSCSTNLRACLICTMKKKSKLNVTPLSKTEYSRYSLYECSYKELTNTLTYCMNKLFQYL